jgi:predicted PhzF superfamily epimerase YddE/YHI9
MGTTHGVLVFTDEVGGHGNPLGVFLDGARVPRHRRQDLARDVGYPEVVYVDDAATGRLRIFSPTAELPFAGHPLVGTGWLLASAGVEVPVLRPPAGDVPTWAEDGLRWVRGRTAWSPEWERIRLDAATEVAAPRGPVYRHDFTQFWAWEDEAAGRVRARVFSGRVGVPEDEACGAASLRLAELLGRPVAIRHGEGSLVRARPGPDGTVELGGLVALDEVREVPTG